MLYPNHFTFPSDRVLLLVFIARDKLYIARNHYIKLGTAMEEVYERLKSGCHVLKTVTI